MNTATSPVSGAPVGAMPAAINLGSLGTPVPTEADHTATQHQPHEAPAGYVPAPPPYKPGVTLHAAVPDAAPAARAFDGVRERVSRGWVTITSISNNLIWATALVIMFAIVGAIYQRSEIRGHMDRVEYLTARNIEMNRQNYQLQEQIRMEQGRPWWKRLNRWW